LREDGWRINVYAGELEVRPPTCAHHWLSSSAAKAIAARRQLLLPINEDPRRARPAGTAALARPRTRPHSNGNRYHGE